MKKINILLSAALMFLGLTAKAQTTITFDTDDYASIGVYDKWEESPFRTGELTGNAGVVLNPSTTPDEVLGIAPNSTQNVVGFQRSRYASNAYGVRIDLKEPIRVTKNLQYIHVMTYLKDKPADSRMMVMGLGKRIEASWSGQKNDEVEQFWALTPANVQPKDGWQDIVVSFKGFSYSKEENENSGIDIYALVIVPDLRTPDEDDADWVAYFDEIVVDNNPDKRFSTEQYALTYDQEAAINRTDRALNKVGVTSNGKTYESNARSQKFYSNNTANSVFSAKAGAEVQPTFGYTGGWMSAYVYVDWGSDALFNSDLNDNGTPATGSDVVSYSALQIGNSWYKSDGSTRGDGNAIGAGVPKFTVPAGTAPGFYRMRYKVDWNSINPAGATDIISNGGGIVDVTLDVHGDEVAVNASQLNGDILVAADGSDLINYVTGYEQPLKVKIVPAPGFVQYGFNLKYGYNVAAKEQLDDKGNPNWIEVNVPFSEIAADSTYTIPAEYMRGSQVSIQGDMQQVQQYTVAVQGLEGRGGAVYANIETLAGGTVNATQYFSASQIEAIAVDGYTAEVTLNDRLITVTYTVSAAPCKQVTSLSDLKNYKLYQIKSNNNEGYLAWNTNITDQYLSLRGVTNFGSGQPNADVRAQYAEEVNPYDVNVTWHILKEGDSFYLYHPTRKAYVTRSGRDYQFTDTKTALDIIRDNGDGTFSFHGGGSYSEGSTNFACIVTNENQIAVRNWTWNDHGSVMQILENPNAYTIEYAIEVMGDVVDGGVAFEETDYADGAILQSTAFLTAADVTAKAVEGYEAEVTIDAEARTISVAYSVDANAPVVVTSILENKLYTLECRSVGAHNTSRFIGLTEDGKISGQSGEAAFIKFEKANEENGYYIKIVDADKYLNHDGTNISASAEKSTIWTLGVPTHTANVVTFTIGNDKYLNNNGSDCADNTCVNLKANSHSGGPGSGNACSLWEMTQYPEPEEEPEDETPTVVTAINNSKVYTLECRSVGAHNTSRFIGVAEDGKISGQSSTAAYIQFEPANTENGYYIKVVAADKYLNHDGTNISAGAEKSTIWTLGVPTHTANVVTFTIGNDKYLNNNGSDCADNTCVNLKANSHSGGPGATNACSLWEMTEYSAKVLEPSEPEEEDAKVYYIQWKNTGANYITEGNDHYLTVAGKNVNKAQSWMFIPSGNENCFYIKNVSTERYMCSSNMNPSSSSRISTTEERVEFYVGATTSTDSEIVGCYYISSTDCDNYADENAGPRALNKDGGSDNVIVWQAGTSRKGSYWKLVEVINEPEPLPEHTSEAQALNIYFNPCGMAGNNYLTSAKVYGEGAPNPVVYKATSKPASWHVPYPHDYGQVVRGGSFNIDITLSATPAEDLVVNAYFDWDANGEFETTVPITLSGTTATTTVSVPAEASEKPMRMRIRVNSSGLDLAEDDVDGFVYDFHIAVVEPQQGLTARVSASAANRGTVTLSGSADSYEYGTELTATATASNGATFVCWKEEGVVVSTDAQYTFVVDHNVNLKAYFTPAIQYNDRLGYYIEKAEAIEGSDRVGDYSRSAVVALADDIAAAKAVSNATQADIDALQNAMSSMSVNMPSPSKLYKIVKPGDANSVAYAGANNSCSWGENTTPAGVWVFEKGSADNKFYLRNLSTGSYTTSYNRDATVVLGEKNQEVTVVYHGANRQMGIAPNGGEQLNRATGRLCVWTDNPGLNSNCAWIIEEVTSVNHLLSVGSAKWASLMLGFDSEIPEGINAYIVSSVSDTENYAQLTKVSGVLPANTAVLINAEEAGSYAFEYSTETPATIQNNELDGSLYNKTVVAPAYALGVKENVVALYTLRLDDSGAFVNYANKAYLPKPATAAEAASAIFFRFDGATDIENIDATPCATDAIYDLTGRRVNELNKGLYIVNGKKVLIK